MKVNYNNMIIVIILSALMHNVFGADSMDTQDDYPYVINLATSMQPVEITGMKNRILHKYKVYTIKDRSSSTIKYHLRLGFFKTRDHAQNVVDIVKYEYLDVYIDTVTANEKSVARQWVLQRVSAESPAASTDASKEKVMQALYMLAEHAMNAGDYSIAIGLYTRIVNAPPGAYTSLAQEKLGIAREKNRQYAHAKAEYQAYIEKYPNSEGAERVQQRLDKLLSQQYKAAFSAYQSRHPEASSGWQHYGYFYQFYYRDTLDTDAAGSITANSSISTNINYTAKSINKAGTSEANVAATHIRSINDADVDKERLTSLYYYTSDNRSYDIRLGRQKPKSSGVFNRYDGIDAGYTISTDYNIKLLTGYPVEFNETVDDRKDKYFYSLGLGLKPERSNWESTLYLLEQKADGLTDRQEVAVDAQFQDDNTTMYSIFDYSMQYETINSFIATYYRKYQDDSQLTLIANYRKSPFLTTTNALQGQAGVSSLADLLSTLTEDEIEQLSLDRTALYKSLSAYYARYLTTDAQLTTDITVSSMSGTVSSGGVEALQATGNEYSYAIGLLNSNVFFVNDLNIINLRYSELATSNVILLSLGSRFRPEGAWRVNPDIRYDHRDYDDGRLSISIRPSISFENRLNKHWEFETRLGYDRKRLNAPGAAITTEKSKLLYAGYIFTF